jgi:hypothetical protein
LVNHAKHLSVEKYQLLTKLSTHVVFHHTYVLHEYENFLSVSTFSALSLE